MTTNNNINHIANVQTDVAFSCIKRISKQS